MTVELHSYQVKGDLLLYKLHASGGKTFVAQWGKGGAEMEIRSAALQAGTYFVRVYAAEGYPSDSLYVLVVR